jgi:hypothetical protein
MMQSMRKVLLGMLILASGLLPSMSFAALTGYTQILTTLGSGTVGTNDSASEPQVIALGTDGLAYLPAWQDTGGTWHTAGQLPGQSQTFRQLVAGKGANWKYTVVFGLGTNGGVYASAYQDFSGTWHANGTELSGNAYSFLATANGPAGNLNIIGVGASDGKAYLVASQNGSGVWTVYNTAISSVGGLPWVVLGIGDNNLTQVIGPVSEQLYLAAYQNTGGSFSSAGALPDTTPYIAAATGAGYYGLTVIGVNASNALLYAADSQNSSGQWFVGAGELPGQSVPISHPVVATGAGGLQVGGLGTNDGLLHMVAYQSSGNGSWNAFGSIPTYSTACTQIVSTPSPGGSLDIIGLATNSHIVLITYQSSGGSWFAGADLTPNGLP